MKKITYRVNEKLIHITDWFPTFLSLAGLENIPDDIDGINQVDVLFGESDLPPGVNFINILQTAFAPLFFCQKSQGQTVIRSKLCNSLSYKKA